MHRRSSLCYEHEGLDPCQSNGGFSVLYDEAAELSGKLSRMSGPDRGRGRELAARDLSKPGSGRQRGGSCTRPVISSFEGRIQRSLSRDRASSSKGWK